MSSNTFEHFGIVLSFIEGFAVILVVGSAIFCVRAIREDKYRGTHTAKGRIIAMQTETIEFARIVEEETPLEATKRELRQMKEKKAREDAFFGEYWLFGDVFGTALDGTYHPEYNITMLDSIIYDEMIRVAEDDLILATFNEGL
jgi:hypothetical protein